jgi:hypothetical protein
MFDIAFDSLDAALSTFQEIHRAPVSDPVRQLREALGEVDDTDERIDLLASQVGSLDSVTRQEYVKLLASEALAEAREFACILDLLSIATAGTNFGDYANTAKHWLDEMLEDLATYGYPHENSWPYIMPTR